MEIGNTVLYYTHEGDDLNHKTFDSVAFVLNQPNEFSYDLVVFPAGGPVRFVRATEFDPDSPYNRAGGSWVREVGSEPPDFGDYFAYAKDPRWREMIRRQDRECREQHQTNELRQKHVEERNALRSELEGSGKPMANPAPVPDKPPIDETDKPRLSPTSDRMLNKPVDDPSRRV